MLEIGTSKNPQGFLFFSFSAFLRPGLSARSYKISCYDIFWPSARIFQKLAKNLPLKSSLFGTRVTMSLEVQCSFKATRNVVTFRFLSALHPQDPSKTPFHPSPTLTASNYKSYKPNLLIFKGDANVLRSSKHSITLSGVAQSQAPLSTSAADSASAKQRAKASLSLPRQLGCGWVPKGCFFETLKYSKTSKKQAFFEPLVGSSWVFLLLTGYFLRPYSYSYNI